MFEKKPYIAKQATQELMRMRQSKETVKSDETPSYVFQGSRHEPLSNNTVVAVDCSIETIPKSMGSVRQSKVGKDMVTKLPFNDLRKTSEGVSQDTIPLKDRSPNERFASCKSEKGINSETQRQGYDFFPGDYEVLKGFNTVIQSHRQDVTTLKKDLTDKSQTNMRYEQEPPLIFQIETENKKAEEILIEAIRLVNQTKQSQSPSKIQLANFEAKRAHYMLESLNEVLYKNNCNEGPNGISTKIKHQRNNERQNQLQNFQSKKRLQGKNITFNLDQEDKPIQV